MPTRASKAVWEGRIEKGQGQLVLGSGSCSPPYSFASRFEKGAGTNPERVEAEAEVTVERAGDGFAIRSSALMCEARVPGLDAVAFAKHAEAAKDGCPVSRALGGVQITLDARLAG